MKKNYCSIYPAMEKERLSFSQGFIHLSYAYYTQYIQLVFVFIIGYKMLHNKFVYLNDQSNACF